MYNHDQLLVKLEKYRSLPSETEWLEFKEAKEQIHFDDLGKYFSALSNEANLKGRSCGWLILGVADKPPRKITGTRYRPDRSSLESLKYEVSRETGGVTFQEIYDLMVETERVLMFQVPAAPQGMPTSWQGHFYGREGESRKALSTVKYEQIRSQVLGEDWSAQPCPDATLDDMDPAALKKAKEKFIGKQPAFTQESAQWSDETFLDKIKLTRNGQITRSALLLLGKPESSHHLTPHPAQITWKLDGEEKAYEHFGPPFLLATEALYQRIRNIRFRVHPFNQLIPVEMTKYDEKVILEVLHNCIAHQDYRQSARIIVTEKIDRVILQNIGSFVDGKVEDYVLRERTPDKYRNPYLAAAMVKLDMIDSMGMGIRRVFLAQRNRFFPLPDYDLSDPNHVAVTIHGRLIDENYTKILMEDAELELEEVLALDNVQKKKPVDKKVVTRLRNKGLVEGRFPAIHISSSVAKMVDKKAEYTKTRGFDDQYYKDLVVRFLEQNGNATLSEFRKLLLEKLPDALTVEQKGNRIRNMLQALSKSGKITSNGKRGKSGKWTLFK